MPEIYLKQLMQALQGQPGAGEENQRQGRLRNHQRGAEPAVPSAGVLPRLSQRVGEANRRALQRRGETEEHCGDERGENGEAQDWPLHPDGLQAREGLLAEPVHAPEDRERDDDAEAAAHHAEHEALHQELTQQRAPAGSQRSPDDQLSAATRSPDQLEMGEVGAGDEQHEAHRAEQRQHCRADRGHHRLPQGRCIQPEAPGGREPLPDALPEPPQLLARLLQRHPAPQAADGAQEVVVVGVHVVAGLEGHRQEELGLPAQPREPGGEHTDDQVRLAVEAERAPEHPEIASEPGAPEGVGEDDPPVRAPRLVAPVEPAAQGRTHPQDGEELGGDDGGPEPLGLIQSREHHRAVIVAADVAEAPLVGAHLVEVGRRAHNRGPALEEDGLHLHQLVCIPVGQRSQEHCAGDAEHRRVRADAQGQREERYRGEPGRLAEAPDGETDLPGQSGHGRGLRQPPCPEAGPGRAPGLGASRPGHVRTWDGLSAPGSARPACKGD